jgi:uncharacterized protein
MTIAPRTALVAMLLTLALTAPATATPLEEAFAAFARGDYATALQIWRPLAERGEGSAQFNMGESYENGRGVPKDYVEAIKWYRLSADQGLASAQNNLGAMYARGRGVARNYVEALKWYRLAADQSLVTAQTALGAMYADGRGVPPNHVQAHVWFSLAATQRHRLAVKGRDLVARRMTTAQLAEAQLLASERKHLSQPAR